MHSDLCIRCPHRWNTKTSGVGLAASKICQRSGATIRQSCQLKPPQKKDKVSLDPSEAILWYFGQCRLLGEAIVGKKRCEQKFRPVYVFDVVAQRTRRRLELLFQREQLQNQGVNCVQLWSPWSFRGKCYNLLQREVYTRFICIAKPSCTLFSLLGVFALVRSLSILTFVI